MAARKQETTTGGGRRKRDILTKAQWEKIEREARKAEIDPDPAQLSWIPKPDAADDR